MAAKASSGLGWEDISERVGLSPVFLTSACLGMNSLKKEFAEKLCEVLKLPQEVSDTLEVFPHKTWEQAVPTDPLIYRLYEIIHEKFGDGIMSAIDYSMHVEKEENPAGDRVVITLNGKFLRYSSW